MSDAKKSRRPRNPRRLALEVLRAAKRDLSALISRWDQAAHLYDRQLAEATGGNGYRARRDDERVENDAAAWMNLAEWMAAEIDGLQTLREFALDQAARLNPNGAAFREEAAK